MFSRVFFLGMVFILACCIFSLTCFCKAGKPPWHWLRDHRLGKVPVYLCFLRLALVQTKANLSTQSHLRHLRFLLLQRSQPVQLRCQELLQPLRLQCQRLPRVLLQSLLSVPALRCQPHPTARLQRPQVLWRTCRRMKGNWVRHWTSVGKSCRSMGCT